MKRLVVFALSAALIAGSLAGCGKAKNDNGGKAQSGQEGAAAEGQDAADGSKDTQDGGRETGQDIGAGGGSQEAGQDAGADGGSQENAQGTGQDAAQDGGTQSGADGKQETDKEDELMQKYGIEMICPKEYTEQAAGADYGQLIKTTYYSTTCEKERPVNIWLPAGYTEDKQYPVLYLLHGIFGSQNDMNYNSVTIANLIAKGEAKEMIVVFPYMYASKTQDACTAIDVENTSAYDNFVNDLVTDLMPFIKAHYSIAEGRENTAVAGFSMGGRESLAIGLHRPDLFGYVGAIAPAPGLVPGKDWAMDHPGQFAEAELVFPNEVPYLLMICCGDSDKVVGQFPMKYHTIFTNNQVEHVWWEIKGSDHGEPAISSGIYNFCRNIF